MTRTIIALWLVTSIVLILVLGNKSNDCIHAEWENEQLKAEVMEVRTLNAIMEYDLNRMNFEL
jgi:hypothetical protein